MPDGRFVSSKNSVTAPGSLKPSGWVSASTSCNVWSMGVTGAWTISALEGPVIAELSPRFLPIIEAEGSDPDARRRWNEWQRAPLGDYRKWSHTDSPWSEGLRAFHELTWISERVGSACYGSVGDKFCVIADVWERQPEPDQMYFCVKRKENPVAALFHAIGPERAAQLPGWCGNFLLAPAEVRESLPQVERALTFNPEERHAIDDQDWLDYDSDEENIVDGPLRVWRWAAATGLGLCGLATYVY